MNLQVRGITATTLDDTSFRKVLDIYPEEGFAARKVFAEALSDGVIEFDDLRKEAGMMLIPWQMFFMDAPKLDAELAKIEAFRQQAQTAPFAKRKGAGNTTSKRILDRLLRLQAYVTTNHSFPKNAFCGALVGKDPVAAAALLRDHFGIKDGAFRTKNKVDALDYLIEKAEEHQVSVSQGVLANKILPALNDSKNVYKSTSGFVIGHAQLPFVFLPSETNPDEREGRQILTLVYLLVLIGLEAYEYEIEKDFKAKMLAATGKQATAYDVASEFLLPTSVTDALRGNVITEASRDDLAKRHKITPTAVVVILRRRKVITYEQFNSLTPLTAPARAPKSGGPQAIDRSVRKFNGKHAFELINADFAAGRINNMGTQYLLFGGPNKVGFKKYKRKLGL